MPGPVPRRKQVLRRVDVLRVLAVLAAAVAVLTVPGLPAVLALRLRGLLALAVLPAASLLVIGLSAEAAHLLPVPWSIAAPLVLGAVVGALLWPLGRRRRTASAAAAGPAAERTDGADPDPAGPDSTDPDSPLTSLGRLLSSPRGRTAAWVTGLVIGGGVILAQTLAMMGSLSAISQTYDNVFHLNAVRRILRLGDGSAWVVGGMTTLPGNETYYPSLWHQAVSLVTQLSGQEIPLASNLVMLLVGAVVWPLGLMALVRTCTAAGPLGWLLTGALAGVSSAFPLTTMAWGIVLPYLLSLSMMPLVLLVVVRLAGLAPLPHRGPEGRQLAALLPMVCGAVALAHPQGVLVGMALGVPVLLWATAVRARELLTRRPGAGRRLGPLAALTALVTAGSVIAWDVFRPPASSAVWEPNATPKEAIGQALSLAPSGAPTWTPFAVVVLACALAVLLWSRSRWLLVVFAAAAVMSVLTRSLPMGDLRYLVTGGWYSDNHRIAAIIAVGAVPLLAVGGELLLRRAASALPVLRGAAAPVLALSVLLVTGAVLALGLGAPGTRAHEEGMRWHWQSQVLLTDDERALLAQLPEVVPEDAVIATNAWNGSSLAYALSDRQVLNTYMGFQAEPEVHLLNAALDDAATDPEVCEAARELDVRYALDFGPQELHGRHATYTGLNEISETGAAEVVLQVGAAKLLRMLPCRGTDG